MSLASTDKGTNCLVITLTEQPEVALQQCLHWAFLLSARTTDIIAACTVPQSVYYVTLIHADACANKMPVKCTADVIHIEHVYGEGIETQMLMGI